MQSKKYKEKKIRYFPGIFQCWDWFNFISEDKLTHIHTNVFKVINLLRSIKCTHKRSPFTVVPHLLGDSPYRSYFNGKWIDFVTNVYNSMGS